MTCSYYASSSSSRSVRFDKDCILIPQPLPVKRPLMVTRSVSLWKKRSSPPPPASPNASTSSLPLSQEKSHVKLKLPVPSFMTPRKRSSSYGRPPGFPVQRPLPPCLVHRSASIPLTTPRNIFRPPSLAQLKGKKSLPTIPLRACCAECGPILDKVEKAGTEWVEKFNHREGCKPAAGGFAPESGHKLCIIVDEVDRRKSLEEDAEGERACAAGAKRTPIKIPQYPLDEEDEDQLFPLPSPRRSPSSGGSNPPSPITSPSRSASESETEDDTDSMIPASFSRRGRCENGLLCPVPSSAPPSPTS